jgi:AraC family transcriptional regulator
MRKGTSDSQCRAVERLISGMYERLDEPLSLHDMSKISYLSPNHLCRVFKRIVGIPPSQFLYALRLERAKQLLLTTHRSVTDICFEVGYNSLGTFISRFNKLVGMSPRRLRTFADDLAGFTPEWFLSSETRRTQLDDPSGSITGTVSSAEPMDGLIFVGLFQTLIPQGYPFGGTILTKCGHYRIGPVPDGYYFVFAVAFPQANNGFAYLLPDKLSLLVGSGQRGVLVKNGRASGQAHIRLRTMKITDPPILFALPSILTNNFS